MALQVTGQAQGIVLSASQKSGAPAALSTGWHNELLLSELLPRYAALVQAGVVFSGANTAAQALSVNSTTFTGLAVSNPAGSGKNLIILDVSVALAAAVGAVSAIVLGSAAAVALAAGNSAGPNPMLVGSAVPSVAKVGASATLGAAPTVLRPLSGIDWVTGGTPVAQIYSKDEIAGALIVAPGQLVCIEALVAAVTVVGAITWAELPA